jgi:hypothetical protein
MLEVVPATAVETFPNVADALSTPTISKMSALVPTPTP